MVGAKDIDITKWTIRYYRRFSLHRTIMAVLGILILIYIVYVFATGNLQWSRTFAYLLDYRILAGVGYTLLYSVLAMAIGIIGGTLLSIGLVSRNLVWGSIAKGYVALFRALPLIILLLIFYNVAIFLPHLNLGPIQININNVVTPFLAAVLGLALHEAAYMAEIIRAGVNGVDKGQSQAAQSIGMTYWRTLRWVVFPQAMRLIIPPTANQFISMLKNTSLVVVIAGNDLLTVAKEIYANNFLTMELLFVAAIWYLVMVLIFGWLASRIEQRFSKGV